MTSPLPKWKQLQLEEQRRVAKLKIAEQEAKLMKLVSLGLSSEQGPEGVPNPNAVDVDTGATLRRRRQKVHLVPKHVAKLCMRCGVAFSFRIPQEHCGKCGDVICADCLPFSEVVEGMGDVPVSICTDCSNGCSSRKDPLVSAVILENDQVHDVIDVTVEPLDDDDDEDDQIDGEIEDDQIGDHQIDDDDQIEEFDVPDDQCGDDDYSFGQDVYDVRSHVMALLQPVGNGLDGFDSEYDYLAAQQRDAQFDFTAALSERNLPKNRYSNILPPEHSRVLMSVQADADGEDDVYSDYINANYLDGQATGTENRYITCQGPLETTFNDFWRMLWETNACVIMMLTGEIERNYSKCDRYWPDPEPSPAQLWEAEHRRYERGQRIAAHAEQRANAARTAVLEGGGDEAAAASAAEEAVEEFYASGEAEQMDPVPELGANPTTVAYGDVVVTYLGSEQGDEFVIRRFEATHRVEGTTRAITQYQYTGWPDHGIPVSRAGFLQLCRLADESNHMHPAPLIVHCSAGVGRTGTFCTVHGILEHFMEQLEAGQQPGINVLKAVHDMRQRRPGMVQTKEQYIFAYLAILEQTEQWLFDRGLLDPPAEGTEEGNPEGTDQ